MRIASESEYPSIVVKCKDGNFSYIPVHGLHLIYWKQNSELGNLEFFRIYDLGDIHYPDSPSCPNAPK